MPKTLVHYADQYKAQIYRNRHRKNNYQKTREGAYNARQEWTVDEMEMILSSSLCDREISKIIGRSVQAIQMKRSKLNKSRR